MMKWFGKEIVEKGTIYELKEKVRELEQDEVCNKRVSIRQLSEINKLMETLKEKEVEIKSLNDELELREKDSMNTHYKNKVHVTNLKDQIKGLKEKLAEKEGLSPVHLRNDMEKNKQFRNMKKENEWLQEKLRGKDEKIVILNKKNIELRNDNVDFVLKIQLLRNKLYDLEKDVTNKNVKEITVSNINLRSEIKKKKKDKDFVVEKLVHALNVSDYILYILGAQGGSGYFNSTLKHEIEELKKILSATYIRLMGESK